MEPPPYELKEGNFRDKEKSLDSVRIIELRNSEAQNQRYP